jgi:hypothetical protein
MSDSNEAEDLKNSMEIPKLSAQPRRRSLTPLQGMYQKRDSFRRVTPIDYNNISGEPLPPSRRGSFKQQNIDVMSGDRLKRLLTPPTIEVESEQDEMPFQENVDDADSNIQREYSGYEMTDEERRESVGSSKSGGARKRTNPLQVFIKLYENIKRAYYRNVTYKKESVLIAFGSMVLYILIGYALISLDKLEAPNELIAIMLEAILTMIALLAVKSTSVVNSRHNDLVCMKNILSRTATSKEVFAGSSKKEASKILTFSCNFFAN